MSMNYLENQKEEVNGYEILWNMANSLWSNLTLEEFEEALDEEGYEDYYCRVLIGIKDLEWMKKTFGGDGKGRLRERYKQHMSGELDRIENNRIKRLNNLKDKFDSFLTNLSESAPNSQHSNENSAYNNKELRK